MHHLSGSNRSGTGSTFISRITTTRIALALVALFAMSTVFISQSGQVDAAVGDTWVVDIDAATNTLVGGVGTPVTQVLPAGRFRLTVVDGGPNKAWTAHLPGDGIWRTEFIYESATLAPTIVEHYGTHPTPTAALAAVTGSSIITLPGTETVEFGTNDVNQGNSGGIRVLIEQLAPTMYWADWTGTDLDPGPGFEGAGTITTPTGVVTVNYDNPQGIHVYDTGGSTTYDQWTSHVTHVRDDATSAYTSDEVANIPTDTDMVMLRYAGNQTLTFRDAGNVLVDVANPVFAFLSLNGNGYGFDQDFDILSTGGGDGNTCGFHGCGTSSKQIIDNGGGDIEYWLVGTGEPHGTIRFRGSFDTLNWESLGNEVWNGFTVGIAGLAEELPDADGDGFSDDVDEFPSDPTEWADFDGDGTGDNSDAFPHDPSEDTDTDGDGIGDNADPGPAELGRTGWEMFGPNPRVNNIGPYASHGHKDYYQHVGPIPAGTASGWAGAPNAEIIGFSVPSRLGGSYGCLTSLDYTFFQTFVDIPIGTVLTEFKIQFSGMDDGARITVFNTAYPAGLVIEGSYVYLSGGGTTDLAPYMNIGESNRVVITQIDDCATGNNLHSAIVLLNGEAVEPPVTNVDPELTSVGTSVNQGDVAGNSGAVTDVDGDNVALTASVGSVVNNGNGTWTWTGAGAESGLPTTYDVTIDGDDGEGGSASTTFTVTVNRPPVVEIDSVVTDNTVYYVDWQSADSANGLASGEIVLPNGDVIDVDLTTTGSTPLWGVQHDGTIDGSLAGFYPGAIYDPWNTPAPYTSLEVPNAPPGDEIVTLSGGTSTVYTVTLSEPIIDPIMAILSLGRGGHPTDYDFDSPFSIVSQGNGHHGGCATCLTEEPGDILRGQEGHGTIRFDGTFTTFSWTVPVPENWHGFTFAIRSSIGLAQDVEVDEGDIALNSGTWSDPDFGDIVTLDESVGTVVQNGDGTWDWSLATADGPDDSQSVTITATDSHGLTDSATFDLIVNNVAPTANAGGPYSGLEGTSIALSGAGSDVPADTMTFDWDLDNDGTFETPGQNVTFPAVDDIVQTVNLRVSDEDGGSSISTTTVTVDNVKPRLGRALRAIRDEGETYNLVVPVRDPGVLDTFAVVVDWGDGSIENFTYPAGTTVIEESHVYVDDNPTITPSDSYRINVSVTDDDGGLGKSRRDIIVRNVAPSLTFDGPAIWEIDENGTITIDVQIDDPGVEDTFEVEILWTGGGVENLTLPAGTTSFSASQQYLDDDPTGTASDLKAVRVEVTDDDSGNSVLKSRFTVNNVDPVITVTGDSIDENGFATVSGTFSDVGTKDTHTVEINWDDGSSSAATVDQGAGTFTASHQYLDDDPTGTSSDVYSVTATVTDDDTGVGSASAGVTVGNIAPVITSLTGDDVAGSVSVNFTDVGSNDTHTVSIDWGDGDSESVASTGATTAAHLFPQFGTYTVQVTVTDDDSGSAVNTVDLIIGGGACECTKSQGWWKKQYSPKQIEKGNTELTQYQIDLLAAMVSAQSAYFAGLTSEGANNVFDPPKSNNKDNGSKSGRNDASATASTGSKKKKGSKAGSGSNSNSATDSSKFVEKAESQVLAAWLNYAKGAVDWNELIDIDGDAVGDMTFGDLVTEVEGILADPSATKSDLERAKDLAEAVNHHDKDNPDCDTHSGSHTGSGSKSGSGSGSGTGTGSAAPKAKGKNK